MKNTLTYLLLLVCLLTFASCDEEVATPSLQATLDRYYPLELNRAAYYQVDSVVLVPTVGGIRYDTARLEARETLVESYLGGDGNTIYRGERWERAEGAAEFRFKQTYTITRTDGTLMRSEDNLSFTKLVLPLRSGVSWDGNAAFDEQREILVGPEFLDVYGGWNYRYGETDQRLTLDTGLEVDSVVTVEQAEVDNLIDLRSAYERYAPGLGLVERFIDARHTQCNDCCGGDTGACFDLAWNDKAEKGMILRQTLIRRE